MLHVLGKVSFSARTRFAGWLFVLVVLIAWKVVLWEGKEGEERRKKKRKKKKDEGGRQNGKWTDEMPDIEKQSEN